MAEGGTRVIGTLDEDILRMLSLPYITIGTARCPDRQAYAATLYNHAKPAAFGLRDIQVDAIYTYEAFGGLLGPIGVGHGKTLITLLCAKVGLERRGHHRACLMVPAEVYSQLQTRDLPEARRNLALDAVPVYLVRGDAKQRMQMAQQPGPGLFVYAYSSLSQPTGSEELAAINATLFVLDEAHFLSRFEAARTRRWATVRDGLRKAIREGKAGPDVRAPDVEVVALSGTITKKSVEDYAHLSRAALGERSPAPLREQTITLLSSCVDATVQGTGLSERDYARLREFVEWARQVGHDVCADSLQKGVSPTFQEQVRDAMRHRLRTAQGVVSTDDAAVGASLIISWSEPPRPRNAASELMATLMKQVVADMVTPNGDVIDFGMHTYKWLWELTAGFYNSLVWPTIDQLVEEWARKARPITQMQAEQLLHQAHEHHGKQQAYHKALRHFLDRKHQPGCDSPMLVAAEIARVLQGERARHKVPPELIELYREMKEADFDDLPERTSTPIRISDYKVIAAVEWCRAHKDEGGIVWFHHPEIGKWLHEHLTEAGIKHTIALAGQNERAFSEGLVLASYAHATGKNLQHQCRNLVLEQRREAHTMEQMLGRTHRQGQKADDVRVDVFISNGFDLALFNAILRDSDYIQSSTGQAQRLCYATYAPIIPPTHPRLAVRLGIIESEADVERVRVEAHETITPPEALDWTDVFRSVRFATAS